MNCTCNTPVDLLEDMDCQPDVRIVETTNGMSGKKVLVVAPVSVFGFFLAAMNEQTFDSLHLMEQELDEIMKKEQELKLSINLLNRQYVDHDVQIVENRHPFHIFMPKQSNRHHARIRKRHVQRLHPLQRK